MKIRCGCFKDSVVLKTKGSVREEKIYERRVLMIFDKVSNLARFLKLFKSIKPFKKVSCGLELKSHIKARSEIKMIPFFFKVC